jgi:hypothetical protein
LLICFGEICLLVEGDSGVDTCPEEYNGQNN